MCLLCCGHTLAAYAEDNVIVGMNEAAGPGHIETVQWAVGSGSGARWLLTFPTSSCGGSEDCDGAPVCHWKPLNHQR